MCLDGRAPRSLQQTIGTNMVLMAVRVDNEPRWPGIGRQSSEQLRGSEPATTVDQQAINPIGGGEIEAAPEDTARSAEGNYGAVFGDM